MVGQDELMTFHNFGKILKMELPCKFDFISTNVLDDHLLSLSECVYDRGNQFVGF